MLLTYKEGPKLVSEHTVLELVPTAKDESAC